MRISFLISIVLFASCSKIDNATILSSNQKSNPYLIYQDKEDSLNPSQKIISDVFK